MREMSDEEVVLLAAVRAATSDDGPRAVYADWLLERGDPLGEYITLALAESRAELSTDAQERMVALLRVHEAAWLGPVHEVSAPSWERGLPYRSVLALGRDLGPAIGAPAWRRVQRLDALGPLDVAQAAPLVGDATLRDLHELGVVTGVLSTLLERDAVPDVARLLVFGGPRPRAEQPVATPGLGRRIAELIASRARLQRVHVSVPTSPADFASLRREDVTLGVAHALRDLGDWQTAFDEGGAAFAELQLAGSHGFSRVRNYAPLEAVLRRDGAGRWSVLEVRWGASDDHPTATELLAFLDTLQGIREDAFTHVSAVGPLGYPWLPRFVELARRQRRASFGGMLAKATR